MENRETYFDNLHLQLAKKHNLTFAQVETVRSSIVGDKKSRKELAEIIAIKLHQPARSSKKPNKNRRSHNISHYQTLLNFIASCSTDSWNDITQITEFDRPT